MFVPNFNNSFFRVYAIHTDRLGIDPLRDKLVDQICEINEWSPYDVRPDERGAPDLISLRVYGADHFWWHIMTYNGICSYKDIVEGTTLRMPSLTRLITLTTDNSLKLDGAVGIVKI